MISKGAFYLKARLLPEAGTGKLLEAIPVRIAKQPLHPLAALRQGRLQQRNFSTVVRRVVSSVSRPIQSARLGSSPVIRSAISKSSLTPFASPLRPNLTGGALPRSSGGYSLGGRGVRHFSNVPAAQAHVLQNVSAAVRAFCVNGYKVQYDGTDVKTGVKKFRTITTLQEKTLRNMQGSKQFAKGTTLEFRLAPTITAIADAEATLGSEEVVNGLASDFSRSLSSLAAVHADLKRLAKLGSLPITHPNPYTLHVRFAGCDSATVYALCDELGVQRGIVREDSEWSDEHGDKDVEMALLFPWAPSQTPTEHLFGPPTKAQPMQDLDWGDMMSESAAHPAPNSSHSEGSMIHIPLQEGFSTSWQDASCASSFDELQASDIETNDELGFGMDLTQVRTAQPVDSTAYEGMEGVLKFLEQCDSRR